MGKRRIKCRSCGTLRAGALRAPQLKRNDDGYKTIWVVFAVFASAVSILHATLNTNEKLKQYTKLSSEFSQVKMEFESFRHELSIFPDFDVLDCFEKHQRIRKMYKNTLDAYTPDFMPSNKIENRAQTILNQKLGVEE